MSLKIKTKNSWR